VPSFTDSKDIIGAIFKKTGHVTLTTPIRGLHVIPRLAFDIFHLHTKFGNSRFSRSGDMIAKLNMRHVTLTTPLLRIICHQNVGT